tara:strand:+ start:29 stop:394 length:366 start_codon:yes stop_codon:yes gene_type:complete
MKNFLMAVLIVLGSLSLNAQETSIEVNKGDIYVIVKPSGNSYKHINFPRQNIILKKGGVLTNQTVNGKEVIVTKVTKKNNGSTKIKVKPTDGTGFYKVIKSVSINFEEAIKSGEIRVKEDS